MSVYPIGAKVQRNAKMSDDEAYCYSLTRAWADKGSVMRVVTLFPTLGNPIEDDTLTQTLAARAAKLGHAAVMIFNLYALRVARPVDLWKDGVDAIGPMNDRVIMEAAAEAHTKNAPMVAAWGAGAKDDRIRHVRLMTDGIRWVTFGPLMPSGHPRHPLFLEAGSTLTAMPAVKWA